MTSNSIINFIDYKKIFSKGENSFECGYVKSFNYIPDVGILSGQVHARDVNEKDEFLFHSNSVGPFSLKPSLKWQLRILLFLWDMYLLFCHVKSCIIKNKV